MRFAWLFAVVLGGCGLTLDLDPPDPSSSGLDAGRRDAGSTPDAGADPCEDAQDGKVCDQEASRICLGGLCVRSRCGDGFVDEAAGETCEDGNEVSADGCEPGICRHTCDVDGDCGAVESACATAVCTPAHVCATVLTADGTPCTTGGGSEGRCRGGSCIPSSCGDGVKEPDEACDDGNAIPGDGCEPDCSLICRVDEDCSDRVDCNGVEVCERENAEDAVRARCVAGRAPPIPVCFDCDLLTGRLVLRDADGDGYAPDDDPSCEGRGGDCDDADPDRHPGAPDFGPGDGVDDDCDGAIDEDRVATCYRDADGDRFGVPTEAPIPVDADGRCPRGMVPAPADAASFAIDCDDADADVFPGQTAWFSVSRCATGATLPPGALCWDYDCDGVETKHWPRAAACLSILGRACNDQGWSLGDGLVIPACGVTGTWTTCADLGLACVAHLAGTPRTQECR